MPSMIQSPLARLSDEMGRGSGSNRELSVSADEVNRLRTRIRDLQNDIDTSLTQSASPA